MNAFLILWRDALVRLTTLTLWGFILWTSPRWLP